MSCGECDVENVDECIFKMKIFQVVQKKKIGKAWESYAVLYCYLIELR